ncbi:hypothetical protein D3C78_1654560 [compost metagenome]
MPAMRPRRLSGASMMVVDMMPGITTPRPNPTTASDDSMATSPSAMASSAKPAAINTSPAAMMAVTLTLARNRPKLSAASAPARLKMPMAYPAMLPENTPSSRRKNGSCEGMV